MARTCHLGTAIDEPSACLGGIYYISSSQVYAKLAFWSFRQLDGAVGGQKLSPYLGAELDLVCFVPELLEAHYSLPLPIQTALAVAVETL
jgi:hypothetical protein